VHFVAHAQRVVKKIITLAQNITRADHLVLFIFARAQKSLRRGWGRAS
jgi:hypothetical protein